MAGVAAGSDLLIDAKFLEKLERLAIRWQKSLPGLIGGHHASHFSGAGQEFLDHRRFHQGDDIRAVNWRAYLRLDKLFLKMFQLEPRIPVRILFDTSNSMTTGGEIDGALSKFDYARKLAAAIAFVGLVRLDTLTLQPFASQLGDSLTLGGGRHRFQPAVHFLSALTPGGNTDFHQVARSFLSRYSQRGLVIVISDFLDDGDNHKPLQYLADFGHELILAQVWADEDREPLWNGELDLEDAETGKRIQLAFDDKARASYVAAFDEYARELRNLAQRNGGRYVGIPTSLPVEDAVFGSLVGSGTLE